MDSLERLLVLTDRLLMHLDHDIPPEKEVIAELRETISEVRKERDLPAPVIPGIPGTT